MTESRTNISELISCLKQLAINSNSTGYPEVTNLHNAKINEEILAFPLVMKNLLNRNIV